LGGKLPPGVPKPIYFSEGGRFPETLRKVGLGGATVEIPGKKAPRNSLRWRDPVFRTKGEHSKRRTERKEGGVARGVFNSGVQKSKREARTGLRKHSGDKDSNVGPRRYARGENLEKKYSTGKQRERCENG